MQLVNVEFIPNELQVGKFYYSEMYQTATHICPCGCGQHIPIPIKEGEWQILNKEKLTVVPSFQQRMKCMAHYVITDGYVNILQQGQPREYWDAQFYNNYDAQPGE